MSTADTIRVPLSSNTPPYRIDEVGPRDSYVRIRRLGSDLLVLVPPGDGAVGFRARLVEELRAYAARRVSTRRFDGVLGAVLFVVVPLLLLVATLVTAAGVSPLPPGSVLARAAPIVLAALLLGYVAVLLEPRYGLVESVTTVPYPRDPEDALRGMDGAGIRYLGVNELAGGPAMEALRHDVLARPGSLHPEEWAALWALAARDDLYPSALVSIRELAWLRLEESMTAGARGFAAQMQVAIEAFECAQAHLPPTSPGEITGTQEEAS